MRNLLILWPTALNRWAGSTFRLTQIASGLVEHGWHTTVVKTRNPSPLSMEVEEAFPGDIVRVPFSVQPYPRLLNWRGGRRLYHAFASAFRKDNDPFRDPRKGWAEHVVDRSYGRLLNLPVDVVFGVTTGDVRTLYGARSYAQRVGKPFVLEFQDPCPAPHAEFSGLEELCLEQCVRDCSGILTTTASYANVLRNRYPFAEEKIQALHLSYTEANRVVPPMTERHHRLVLLHAGELYKHSKGERTAKPLVRAIKRAIEDAPGIRGRVLLQLLGGGPGGEEAATFAGELGTPESVELGGVVSHNQAIAAMDVANVLVVIKFTDPSMVHQIPGKLFEYLGRRKPILGIMGECEAADIIRKSGLGVTFRHDQIDEIAAYILRYARSPELLENDFKPNESYIAQFSVSAMAKKLNAFLENVLRGDTNPAAI